MDFTSDACWFLLIKTLLIKNNKKIEAALKNEAGGDEKRVFFFFTWPNIKQYCLFLLSIVGPNISHHFKWPSSLSEVTENVR